MHLHEIEDGVDGLFNAADILRRKTDSKYWMIADFLEESAINWDTEERGQPLMEADRVSKSVDVPQSVLKAMTTAHLAVVVDEAIRNAIYLRILKTQLKRHPAENRARGMQMASAGIDVTTDKVRAKELKHSVNALRILGANAEDVLNRVTYSVNLTIGL